MKSITYAFAIDIADEDSKIEDDIVKKAVVEVLEKIHGISNVDFLWSAENHRHEPFRYSQKYEIKKY